MEALAGYIFKAAILLLLGLALWAIKAYLRERTEIQRAPCGFMTLADIEAYCQQRSDAYTATITDKVDNLVNEMHKRLENGDQKFRDHSERLRGLEKQLIETTAVLRLLTDGKLRDVVKEAVKEAK